ncbi:MAG: hypothetical protein Q4D02_05870 [Clostridia bacterium]|nr:hypothetical protein [Clostridia bacterium]
MYEILRFVLPIICIVGIIYMILIKNKYKNDTSSSKEDIIKYFKDNNITNLENGIKTKELPKEIAKNPYLLMMVQDKTLTFKKGKYYLNK